MLNYPYDELPRYYLNAMGIRTAYYEAGQPNGRPLIMLHGMSTSADSFREAIHELADTEWLIAPDIPGFGYSDEAQPFTFVHLVEWLAAFCAARSLSAVSLLGHSFGGTLATTYALAYPEDVQRLVLAAPAILSGGNYPPILKKVGVSLGLIDLGSTISQSSLMVKRQIKTPFYDPEKQDDSVWERRLQDYALSRASADVLKVSAFHDLRPDLPRLQQPTMLIWGEDDKVVPVQDGYTLLARLPNADLETLPQCGHVVVLEQQERFQTIVRDFMNGEEIGGQIA